MYNNTRRNGKFIYKIYILYSYLSPKVSVQESLIQKDPHPTPADKLIMYKAFGCGMFL